MVTFEEYVLRCGEFGYVWPDRLSLEALLDGPALAHRKSWRNLLRQVYGVEALTLGYVVFGRQLKLRHLELLSSNLAQTRARVHESASLAPLLAPFILVGRGLAENYGTLRDGLLRRGLTPAGWRWLSHQSAATVRQLFRFGASDEAIFWTNVLCKALPQRTLSSDWIESGRPWQTGRFLPLLSGWQEDSRTKAVQQLERYFRALPGKADPQVRIEHELVLGELYRGFQHGEFDLIQPKQTWPNLLRKLRELQHRREEAALAAQTVAPTTNVSWEPLLEPQVFNGVTVVELCSQSALLREGLSMAHCVGNGSYAVSCKAGSSAIFCLTHESTGSRATLELTRASRSTAWRLSQLSGVGNSRPSALFWSVATTVRDLCNT